MGYQMKTKNELRYSRFELFSYGRIKNLREKSVIIVGVGGLGAVVSELLTRFGIGKIVIFDYDTLEIANMNRLIYKPSQIGLKKVRAIKQYLNEVNPDTKIVALPYDITTSPGIAYFEKELKKTDLLFGCVDTFHVRMMMNTWCVKFKKSYIDGGASEDGINGAVQTIIPGKTACYRCNVVSSQQTVNRRAGTGERSGRCHITSLPTTMAIISALQVQEGIKYLLGFGKVTPYLLYNGIEGSITRIELQRNPNCYVCR